MDALLSSVAPTSDLLNANELDTNTFTKLKTDTRFLSSDFFNVQPTQPVTAQGTQYNFRIPSSYVPR
jgi:hypothetical protein